MNNQAPKHDSFFESMAQYLKPIESTYLKPSGYITGIQYETTIDKIIVIADISLTVFKPSTDKTEVIVIEHDDYREWCEDEGLLKLELGEIDDPYTHHLSYAEYLMEHMDKHDVAEYMAQKSLVNNYAWIYPQPMHGKAANAKKLTL